MVRVSSLFSQILHHFPRSEFASLVKKHDAEYKAKGGVRIHVLCEIKAF